MSMKMLLNTVTFYNITDYWDCIQRIIFNGEVVNWRGVEYTIDDTLETGEMYSRKEVIGGSTYYYV